MFLDISKEFRGHWSVESLWPEFFFDFEEIVGPYRTIAPAKLSTFFDLADSLEYQVCFIDTPETILSAYTHLSDPPPFSIKSDLPNTVKGFLPWQISGFNKLVRDEDLNAGLVVWSTGCGKSIFIASAILWHQDYGHPFDLALVVVKANNKADMNRKLKRLADIDSIIIDGTPDQRLEIYAEIEAKLREGEQVVGIVNYEKFREDPEYFKILLKKRNVLVFWDEAPSRLSNRNTKLYKSIKKCLWDRFSSRESGLDGAQPSAAWLRQWGLTATPIPSDPEAAFNYIRLMNPPLLGLVEEFQGEYVSARNFFSKKPERWHNLPKLEAKLEHLTHRVSREEDPEVNRLFPEVIEDTVIIDWHPDDRFIYDILTGKAKEMVDADFEDVNILALIQILQMVCDAPSMIVESARNRKAFEDFLIESELEDGAFPTFRGPKGSGIAPVLLDALKTPPSDIHHTKMEAWREILMEKHPNDKVLTFMTWSSYGFKPLTTKLDEWGITYVAYEGTQKMADAAKDRFREDPDVRVFLSSDRGADSIDLPEAAVGINYNLPWTWASKRQRMRNVRVDSQLETNYWYDLVMANSVEERKQEIIQTKYSYHAALFDGKAVDDTLSARLSRDDLLKILFGD